ncbi:MAG TPA: glycosyltransferase family 4 protein [Candidatus Sulfotelmatobacter sp.]|nr:glycosyltransferase family 4 protein [Candidatus Sulfotelmatobacter sp.]
MSPGAPTARATPDRAGRAVLVAHPGAAHFIYELVAAVAGLGFATHFETGFYYDDEGALAGLVAALPAALRRRVTRELGRRRFDGIDPAVVHHHPDLELPYVAAARLLRRHPATVERVLHWRNRRFDDRIARIVERARPAVVIGHDTSALRMLRAARRAGAVSVLNQLIGHLAVGDAILREEAERHPEFADSLHAGAPAWLIAQCRDEAREADCVLAPSDYVRRTLIEQGVAPERIALVPFGVRVERFRPASEPRADGVFRLLYVGQISQRKGIKYLLEAVRHLGRRDVELVLVGGIVGSGAGLAPYASCFRHVPNVPHAELHRLFQSADLFVYPSLHEGSALAIFEAMASGLPVITTENAGSMVRDGIDGYLVPLRDPAAIERRIVELQRDPERRRAMAASARRRAEDFTWMHYRARVGVVLDRLIAARAQAV